MHLIYLIEVPPSLSLSLSLSLSTDLGVGGGFAGQPLAGLCFVVGYRRRDESGAAMSSSKK